MSGFLSFLAFLFGNWAKIWEIIQIIVALVKEIPPVSHAPFLEDLKVKIKGS